MNPEVPSHLAELNDPAHYARFRQVAIFDEHTDTYWVDSKGRSVPRGTKGAIKRTRKFSRQDLQRLAATQNQRTGRGDLCPLVIGHTDPEEPDERKQPPIVGYAANYRVGFDPRRGKHMLYADYYIRKDRVREAREFPRTSVELWPAGDEGEEGEEFIDPISLLRRTPRLDLSQWCYRRNVNGRTVLRYSMEQKPAMNDDLLNDDAGGAPVEPSDDEKIEQYERHCYSHPYAADYHSAKARKYAMAAEPAPEPPPGDPTAMPEADQPDQFAAFPSATNAFPAAGEDEPKQHNRNGKAAQYRKDQDAIRYARMQAEIDQLKHARAEAESRQIVTQLTAEGYMLDAGVEVPEFAKLDEAGRSRRAAHVRKYYRCAPVRRTGPLPVADSSPAGEIDLDDPENSLSPADQEKVLQYSKKHNEWDFAKAARAVFPQRFKK